LSKTAAPEKKKNPLRMDVTP